MNTDKSGVKIGPNTQLSILHRIDAMNDQKLKVAEALKQLASKASKKQETNQ